MDEPHSRSNADMRHSQPANPEPVLASPSPDTVTPPKHGTALVKKSWVCDHVKKNGACGKSFTRHFDLKRHARREHEKASDPRLRFLCLASECEFGKKGFYTWQELRNHLGRVHKESTQWKCLVEACAAPAMQSEDLLPHLQRTHSWTEVLSIGPELRAMRVNLGVQEDMECFVPDCRTRFKTLNGLYIHLSTHQNHPMAKRIVEFARNPCRLYRPTPCPLCQQIFLDWHGQVGIQHLKNDHPQLSGDDRWKIFRSRLWMESSVENRISSNVANFSGWCPSVECYGKPSVDHLLRHMLFKHNPMSRWDMRTFLESFGFTPSAGMQQCLRADCQFPLSGPREARNHIRLHDDSACLQNILDILDSDIPEMIPRPACVICGTDIMAWQGKGLKRHLESCHSVEEVLRAAPALVQANIPDFKTPMNYVLPTRDRAFYIAFRKYLNQHARSTYTDGKAFYSYQENLDYHNYLLRRLNQPREIEPPSPKALTETAYDSNPSTTGSWAQFTAPDDL